MKHSTSLLLAALLCSGPLLAQAPSCDSDRYLEQVFDEVEVQYDLSYGQNLSLAGTPQELLMDIYTPRGDTARHRPLVVMAHGGAFISGDRSDTEAFCTDFARRGYVVANMSYRLIDQFFLDSIGMFRAVLMAVHDMRAVVRFMKQSYVQGNGHGIDTSYIFAAGGSAGAIMASHLGFWDPEDEVPPYMQEIINEQGGFEGNSNPITAFQSRVRGVLNYSGALMRSSWIDEGDVPLYSAHDDLDPTVPCSYGTSNVIPFPVYMYGSCAMKEAADQAGLRNQLYLVQHSSGHVSYVDQEESRNQVYRESAAFLKSILCQSVDVKEPVSLSAHMALAYPNPFHDVLHLPASSPLLELRIYNATGQLLLQRKHPSAGPMDLSHLPRGIYLIHLRTPEGKQAQKVLKL